MEQFTRFHTINFGLIQNLDSRCSQQLLLKSMILIFCFWGFKVCCPGDDWEAKTFHKLAKWPILRKSHISEQCSLNINEHLWSQTFNSKVQSLKFAFKATKALKFMNFDDWKGWRFSWIGYCSSGKNNKRELFINRSKINANGCH